ncbi:MAG: hypothetical protein JNL67_09790 [Planctomycetaceae bacterium]|nr:hypothetical protein [Planctomycetaceae bacterium]
MWRIMGIGRTVFLVAMALIGYFGYFQFWNAPSSDHGVRLSMAEQICLHMTQSTPLPNERIRMVVAQSHGDVAGILTRELRQAFARRNVVVVDVTPWDAYLPTILWPGPDLSLENSVELAASHEVPCLLFSQIEHWTISPTDEARLSVNIRLVDTNKREIVYSRSFSVGQNGHSINDPNHSETENVAAANRVPNESWESPRQTGSIPFIAFLTWMVVCLVAPWLGRDFIATALRSNSNLTSMTLILVYLLVVVAVGCLTWVDFESRWLTAMLLCGVAMPWLGYFEFVCRSVAHRLEH